MTGDAELIEKTPLLISHLPTIQEVADLSAAPCATRESRPLKDGFDGRGGWGYGYFLRRLRD
jgi:hypothetical protein